MSRSGPTRRTLIRGTAALVTGLLAGCTGDTDGANSSDAASTRSPDSTSTADPTTVPDTASPTSPAPRDVSFQATTGASLQGTLYGSTTARGSCATVLVPQVNMDRESWSPQASKLADAGFLPFAIDEGADRAAGVVGAVQYLRAEHDVEDVVLVGASTGGEAVVTAAARLSDGPAGVVTLSAAGGAEHAAEFTGRTLFVVGSEDEERFVETARSLHENASEPTELLVYERPTHGQRFFDSAVGDDLFDRLRSFTSTACS